MTCPSFKEHILRPGTRARSASCQSSPSHPGGKREHSVEPERVKGSNLDARQVKWSHLYAEIYYGYISIVEFVQLVSFSEIKLFKP